jgi:uncharacterized protein (TIGR03118 family)
MAQLRGARAPGGLAALLVTMACVIAPGARADAGEERDERAVAFMVTNLDANTSGRAPITDPNLRNAWGIAFAPGGPFWINDNAAGVSTLYGGDGSVIPLVVNVPPPSSADPASNGAPTGMIWNPTSGFRLTGTAFASIFVFATENGTLAGWNPQANRGSAITVVDHSAQGAVYKGLAFGTNASGNHLYATDFHSGQIEVFDNAFTPVAVAGSFTDPRLPAGFAPFGIQNIDGDLWVSYAQQDADRHDDVGGPGSGYVDVYDTDGHLLRRFAKRGVLNSPWGLARAPYGFGQFGGAILIGNFKDGRINAFDARGHYLGTLRSPAGAPIVIDGLWGLSFGGGAKSSPESLYFTAGPDGESNGLFGLIQATMQDPD